MQSILATNKVTILKFLCIKIFLYNVTLQNLVFSLQRNGFNIKKVYVLPTRCTYEVFCVVLRTEISSQYSTKLLLFINESECESYVYWTVHHLDS